MGKVSMPTRSWLMSSQRLRSLLVGMQPVAGGRLRDLPEERLHVLLHELAESGQLLEPLGELPGLDAQRPSRDLGDGANGERSTRDQGHSDDPLVADRRHLDDVPVGERRDQRDHPVDREVHERNGLPRIEEDGFNREMPRPKLLHERVPLHFRQSLQQVVACRCSQGAGLSHWTMFEITALARLGQR